MNEELNVSAIKINKLVNEVTGTNAYSVYAIKEGENYQEENYYVIKIDSKNETFCVLPLEKDKYEDLDQIKIKNTTTEIEKNKRNTVNYSNINEGQIATKYFQEYKNLMLNNPEKAYKKLDNDYSKDRFGEIDEFKKYINENIKNIQLSQIYEYTVNLYDDYNEYVAKDYYDNIYIFKEDSPNNYTVKLDTYTIPTEKFKETYNSSEDYKKVQMNIDKFFQMINRHDYKTSYECLTNSYKNNYFKTEEEFANFARNNFFSYNKVAFKDCKQKGEKLYVFNIELTDLTGESEDKKEVTIVMQLNEELNFEMSFSM